VPYKAGSIIATTGIDQIGFKTGLTSLKKVATVGGAAIAAAFAATMATSIKAADQFKKEIANVSTIIDTSVISVDNLEKEVLKLDPALGSASEMTKALYQSFSSGAETAKEAMQVTVDAAKFAKGALTTNAVAVDVLTTAVNAYGKANMDTAKASDIFFKGIQRGKLTGDQLASSIGASIPLFAATKIEMTQLVTGMAALTKQGVDAANATTQLNAIVNAFLKPSEAMTEALNSMGYASGSVFLETEGLSGALKMLETVTDGDATAMAELLPNIRALRGAMALTGTGGEEFNSILAEMSDVSGIAQEAFDKQEKTMDTFKNQLDNLKITIGSLVKNYFDKAVISLTNVMKKIQDFLTSAEGIETINNIIKAGGDAFNFLVSMIKPVVTEIKGLVSDYMALDPAQKKIVLGVGALVLAIKPAISIVGKLSAAFSILAAHPVVAAIGGIAAAVAGVVLVVNSLNREQRELNRLYNETDKIIANNKIPELVKEYNDLSKKQNLSNEESERQKELGEQLLTLLPDLTQEELNNAAALEAKAEQQRLANIQQSKEQKDLLIREKIKLEDKIDAETEAIRNKILAAYELSKIDENNAKIEAARTKAYNETADASKRAEAVMAAENAVLEDLQRQRELFTKSVMATTDAEQLETLSMKYLREDLDRLSPKYIKMTTNLSNVNTSIGELDGYLRANGEKIDGLNPKYITYESNVTNVTAGIDTLTNATENLNAQLEDTAFLTDEQIAAFEKEKEILDYFNASQAERAEIERQIAWDIYNNRMAAYWAEIDEKKKNEKEFGQYLTDADLEVWKKKQETLEAENRGRFYYNEIAKQRVIEWNNLSYQADKDLLIQKENNYKEYGQYISDVELEVYLYKKSLAESEANEKEIFNVIAAQRSAEWAKQAIDRNKKEYEERQNNFDEYSQYLTDAELELWQKEQDALKEKEQTFRNHYNATIGIITTAMSVITSVIDTELQNEINAKEAANKKELDDIDKKYKALIEAEEKKGNDTTALEEKYRKEKEAAEKRHNDKLNVILKQQFDNAQREKRASAVINSATAIMGWWAEAPKLGPIAGPIFAGVQTALSVAQLSAQLAEIDAQQFTPRKTGGPARGLTRVYEDGGEIINLPSGSFVIPNEMSENLMQSKNEINVSFAGAYINSELDLDVITNHVSKKLARQLR
jgi:TP901 family phage tail tape measure protein